MRKFFRIFLFCFFSLSIFGNDWDFYFTGKQIVPFEISETAIKKEIIKINIEGKEAVVNVKFIFDSPTKSKKMIGFVAPTIKNTATPGKDKLNVRNFETKVNRKKVDSNIEKLDYFLKKGIMSEDRLKKYTDEEYLDNYVYYFNADFVKGENVVEHSYKGDYIYDFEYVLTTISKWKNKKVDDFELIIEPGNKFVQLQYSFWNDEEMINWEIVGEGKLTVITPEMAEKAEGSFGQKINENIYARLKNGYIRYKAENFAPDKDFYMKYIENIEQMEDELPREKVGNYIFTDKLFMIAAYGNEKEMRKLSNKDLDIVKNYLYAIAGYDFSKNQLKDYFSKFVWYVPINKDVKIDDYNKLTEKINKIKKERSRK